MREHLESSRSIVLRRRYRVRCSGGLKCSFTVPFRDTRRIGVGAEGAAAVDLRMDPC